MTDLWEQDTPQHFWLCDPPIPDGCWNAAVNASIGLLEIPGLSNNPEALLRFSLGEGRFGPSHWTLSPGLQVYYLLKPAIPRALTRVVRRVLSRSLDHGHLENWPIDARYASFQLEVLRQAMLITGATSVNYRSFWPDGNRCALVLTHDVETAAGQMFVREVAALEESLGFRSSFNFVLQCYPLDLDLLQELRQRGFEVGCHGLRHDGKLFRSHSEFVLRAAALNARMRELQIMGFRSPLTHRNPVWMQALDIDYDSSFFDTDPFEPIPGGAMTIWPFFIGHFVELPYTLVQDHTLISILGEVSPRIWMQKVEFIEQYHGMVLLNTHPDYLRHEPSGRVYREFLSDIKKRGGYWHALPREVANWWRRRSSSTSALDLPGFPLGHVRRCGERIEITE